MMPVRSCTFDDSHALVPVLRLRPLDLDAVDLLLPLSSVLYAVDLGDRWSFRLVNGETISAAWDGVRMGRWLWIDGSDKPVAEVR